MKRILILGALFVGVSFPALAASECHRTGFLGLFTSCAPARSGLDLFSTGSISRPTRAATSLRSESHDGARSGGLAGQASASSRLRRQCRWRMVGPREGSPLAGTGGGTRPQAGSPQGRCWRWWRRWGNP